MHTRAHTHKHTIAVYIPKLISKDPVALASLQLYVTTARAKRKKKHPKNASEAPHSVMTQSALLISQSWDRWAEFLALSDSSSAPIKAPKMRSGWSEGFNYCSRVLSGDIFQVVLSLESRDFLVFKICSRRQILSCTEFKMVFTKYVSLFWPCSNLIQLNSNVINLHWIWQW